MAHFTKNNVFFFGISILLLVSCSTKRNTLVRRAYHNLTSHYNVYWNGNESFEKALKIIEETYVDDYHEVLPIFVYGNEAQIKSVTADLDRAQEKASKAIQKHSMRFKGKEHVNWIDDSYFLIGKAYFYKKEFVSARRTFNYIIQEFPDDDLRFDAMLWLARTHNQKGEFEKAENILLELQSMQQTEIIPYKTLQEIPLIFAELYHYQKKYDACAEYIVQGIELSSRKKIITRLKFILAQIYLRQEKYAEASELFKEVLHRNPNNQMAFQTKLNIALSFDQTNSEDIKRSLERMLNDIENEAFRDQICYALGELAMKKGNIISAVDYLKKSVSLAQSNTFQKAKSSLLLAGLFYKNRNYTEAGLYYDTCSQFIPEKFPDYQTIKPRLETMVALVGHLNTISEQDSLQRIAALSEEERNAFVDAMIEKHETNEARKKEEQQARGINLQSQLPQTDFSNQSSSAWYFYNPQTLSYGKAQFIKKWGRRTLEDNWHLSRKMVITDKDFVKNERNEVTFQKDSVLLQEDQLSENPVDRKFYLQNLPITEAQLKVSDNKIMEALYSGGILFKESLNDSISAFETFSSLLNRFPENPYKLQTYYHLYKLSMALNRITEMNYYKSRILNEYPGSNYAKIVADPQYFIKMSEQQGEASKFYSEVYEAYKQEQYFLVIDLCEKALANFNDTTLIPKFDYLKTISEGRIGTTEDFILNLKRVISAYPYSEVNSLAKDVLANSSGEETSAENLADEGEGSIYKYLPNTFHNYILIVARGSVNLESLKVRLADFNKKFSKRQRFAVSSFQLDDNHDLITISRFKNAREAEDYLKAINNDKYVLSIMKRKEDFKQFVISNDNYLLFYKDKNIDNYQSFYRKHYEINENSN